MYVCLCEHTGNPLQSRFKKFQILTLAILVFVCVCPLLSRCQSTYFMLHHHFQWSHCSVYILHTGPPLPDLLLARPRHQGRELHVCTAHTACSTLHGTMAHISSVTHPPGISPPTHHYWPSLVTLDKYLQHMVVAISWPSSCPSCYFWQCQHIQLHRWDVFQQSLAKELWGDRFQKGHFCAIVPCLYHLQQ